MTLRESLVILKALPKGWLVVRNDDETIQVKFHPTYRYCINRFSLVSFSDTEQCPCGEVIWKGCEHFHIYHEADAEQKIRSLIDHTSIAALSSEAAEGYISVPVWL
jgi:hypothetical protein